MRARTIFILLLVLILLVTLGPALIAVVSQTIAEGFGCEVDLNRVIPCVLGGKDYGQTFYDLGFLIWYSYLTLPYRRRAVWPSGRWRRSSPSSRSGAGGSAAVSPLSPGTSFLRGAAIAVLLALSPIAITYTAGFIAIADRLRPQRGFGASLHCCSA